MKAFQNRQLLAAFIAIVIGFVAMIVASNATAQTIYEPYVIRTFAGMAGDVGSTDGVGTDARFNLPTGVVVDKAGDIYVSDYGNHTIRKITPQGEVSTFAGTAGASGSEDGTGNNARFFNPECVTIDGAGNLYVTDKGNNTIRKINPSAVVTTFAGSAGQSGSADGVGSAARFDTPIGITVDSVGNLYVADAFNDTIRRITPSGMVTTLAGLAGMQGSTNGTGSAARFFEASGVATDSGDNIYVSDYANHTIRKITPNGAVTTVAGFPGAPGSRDGALSAARFNYPVGLAVDAVDSVYIADYQNHTIRKLGTTKVVSLAGSGSEFDWGSNDGTGGNARFEFPAAVAVASSGELYIADTHNHTIRVGAPELRLISAVSRKVQSGDFDIPLALSGSPAVECRSGGETGNHTLRLTFDNTVVSGGATVVAGSGSVDATPVFDDQTMIVELAAVANAQTLTIRLHNVVDRFSQVLPDTTLSVSFLLGDTNGNGVVNASDVTQTKAQAGHTITSSNFREDVNGNGVINASDVSLVKSKSGTALPAGFSQARLDRNR